MKRLITSESMAQGHPDKVADQISDAILDAILAQDPIARVACETFLTTGLVLVGGEITTRCYIDIPHVVRETIREIGYTRAKYGFDCDTCAVLTSIDEQSPDIAMGVDKALEARSGEVDEQGLETTGAGDQGMMFGYASNETPEYMPMSVSLSHRLVRRLDSLRKSKELSFLRPDGKAQVTVEYDGDQPVRIDTIVLSAQHSPRVSMDTLRAEIKEKVIDSVLPREMMDKNTRILINPTGRFVVGGPQGDAGLTGRKIISDTYGGVGRHGGGALSGKDPTKVDRSGCYAMRYVAKNIVAAGLADRCEVQVAYAIGVARPVALTVDTFGTAKVNEENLVQVIQENFDLRPAAIIRDLDLRRPIYKATACYGAFGRRDIALPWESTDKASLLRKAFE